MFEREEVEREIEMESDIWYHGQTTNILLNNATRPLGILNVDNTCYAATSLHCVASIHDDSVPGVLPVGKYDRLGILARAVHHISEGRSITIDHMEGLLRLIQGDSYQKKQHHDASDLIWRIADYSVGLIPMTASSVSEYNQPAVLQVHFNSLPQCLSTCDISTDPDINLSSGSTDRLYGNPTAVLFHLSHDIDCKLVSDVPGLDLTFYSSAKFNGVLYHLVSITFYLGTSGVTGHYITFRKRSCQWYKIDDLDVSPVCFNDIIHFAGLAKVLVYRQVSRVSISSPCAIGLSDDNNVSCLEVGITASVLSVGFDSPGLPAGDLPQGHTICGDVLGLVQCDDAHGIHGIRTEQLDMGRARRETP